MQLKDVTHDESLVQPSFRGNCLNWVLGHILVMRLGWNDMLGLPRFLTEAEAKVYDYGSEPVTCAEEALPLDYLLKKLDENQEELATRLETLTQADMDREVETWRGKVPLVQALSFNQWHESYHTGQLELLRQLSGKNDRVI
jgi:uncharacterized damage-inducible protein DinB